jgi:ABC-type antimicrobial peptide transport system permease subunit
VSVIGAITVTQIVTLAYLERRPHIAVLRALGWLFRSIAQMILSQAAVLSASGGLIAVLLIGVFALVIRASLAVALLAASIAILSAVVAGGIAVIAPLVHAYSARPAEMLRGE